MRNHYPAKRKRGQLIVFGVLVFPVIFVCLAMVINVGMVVHDKINLQNSVDLAAIYAAQKQAEVMDAMAHINYQMRQSYKLFAWRYLVLGNSGAFVYPTIGSVWTDNQHSRSVMNILNKDPVSQRALCPNANPGCHDLECNNSNKILQCPYAVCTIHPLFYIDWNGDNTHVCQNYMFGASARQLPPLTPQTGILPTLSTLLGNETVQDLREQLVSNCSDVGFQNWLVAASMYLAFFGDQGKRKIFVQEKLFPLLQNGRDIENKPIEDGVFKTIQKNLTYVNYEHFNRNSLTFQLVTSEDPQNGKDLGSPEINFEKFFKWDEIYPLPFYVQNTKEGGNISGTENTFCQTTVQSIFQCDPDATNPHLRPDNNIIDSTMSRIVSYSPPGNSETWCSMLKKIYEQGSKYRVSGFYKKDNEPNLGVRVAVDVRDYKGQLFFPFFGSITLSAEAYAKPFGASFGQPQKDEYLVPRISGGDPPHMLYPNYSLFPGDHLGLTNERVQWAWNFLFTDGESFISGNPHIMHNTSRGHGRTFNNYSDLPGQFRSQPNQDPFYDPMVLPYRQSSTGVGSDPNSVELEPNKIFTQQMRIYEEMAIAPNKFDLKHYTILPNYMTTLYPKLKKHNIEYVPADLGHYRHTNSTTIPLPSLYGTDLNLNSRKPVNRPGFYLNYIERQIIYADRQPASSSFASLGIPDVFKAYKASSIDQLLTSWAPSHDANFASSQDMYDNLPSPPCLEDDREVALEFNGPSDPFLASGLERKMIPSHCLKGGRTGFSVKLIHPEAL